MISDTADPDLLAGRAGPADHLAAGGHPRPPTPGRQAERLNLGIYRMQVTGRDTTLMRWLKHRGGAQHYAALERREARALARRRRHRRRSRHDIGRRDAGARHACREYQFAGLLRGKKLELVDC